MKRHRHSALICRYIRSKFFFFVKNQQCIISLNLTTWTINKQCPIYCFCCCVYLKEKHLLFKLICVHLIRVQQTYKYRSHLGYESQLLWISIFDIMLLRITTCCDALWRHSIFSVPFERISSHFRVLCVSIVKKCRVETSRKFNIKNSRRKDVYVCVFVRLNSKTRKWFQHEHRANNQTQYSN